MSGVFKAAGKTFKKVVKTASKVLPIAIGVGALVFTAGAALGALPSWGSGVSSLVSKLGLSDTLARTLTGAVTQAGYGAALGAGASFLSGGKVGKGAMMGALAGAVTGGVSGAAGFETDPLKGLGDDTVSPTASPKAGGAVETRPAMGPDETLAMNKEASSLGLGDKTAAPKSGNGFFQKGGWLERNQTLAGHAIAGAGKGIAGIFEESDTDKLKSRQAIYDANYRTSGRGLLRPGAAGQPPVPQAASPATAQRFDPNAFNGEFKFDPVAGDVVWMPREGAA